MDAVTSSVHETNTFQTTWLSSLTVVPDMLKGECINIAAVPYSDLIAAQQEDPAVVYILCESENVPTTRENSRSLLLYDSTNINGTNGLSLKMKFCVRKSGSRDQMALPKKHHKKVHEELHEIMEYKGSDRVVELAR